MPKNCKDVFDKYNSDKDRKNPQPLHCLGRTGCSPSSTSLCDGQRQTIFLARTKDMRPLHMRQARYDGKHVKPTIKPKVKTLPGPSRTVIGLHPRHLQKAGSQSQALVPFPRRVIPRLAQAPLRGSTRQVRHEVAGRQAERTGKSCWPPWNKKRMAPSGLQVARSGEAPTDRKVPEDLPSTAFNMLGLFAAQQCCKKLLMKWI